jgi:hypothetical protein
MGGITNVARFLAELATADGVRLAGLCDAGEERLVARGLERAGLASGPLDRAGLAALGFFVCDRDLEDELLRALGPERVEAVIAREGELASLRNLQQMPFHRNRTTAEHLHRFLGTRSGRKQRYAPLLAGALDADELPAPLRDLLAFASVPGSAEQGPRRHPEG